MSHEHGRSPRDSGLELDWKGRTRPEERAEPQALAETGAGRGPPGDPRYMGPEVRTALAPLLEGPSLSVRQVREWAEAITGWETRNNYEAFDANGQFMLFIGETGEGWANTLLRNLWPFRRVELECRTKGGTLALRVEQPWTFFFTHVEVMAWDGRPLGYIQQRLGLLHRVFDLCTPSGTVLATLEGPLWRPWTFRVKQRGVEVATIRKQWSGFVSESFTDADNFGVELQPGLTDARLRQLVLAATLMVDLCYFDNNHRGSSGGSLLGRLFE